MNSFYLFNFLIVFFIISYFGLEKYKNYNDFDGNGLYENSFVFALLKYLPIIMNNIGITITTTKKAANNENFDILSISNLQSSSQFSGTLSLTNCKKFVYSHGILQPFIGKTSPLNDMFTKYFVVSIDCNNSNVICDAYGGCPTNFG